MPLWIPPIADNANNDEDFTRPMFLALNRMLGSFSDIFSWDGGSISNLEVHGSHYAAPLAAVSGNRVIERCRCH